MLYAFHEEKCGSLYYICAFFLQCVALFSFLLPADGHCNEFIVGSAPNYVLSNSVSSLEDPAGSLSVADVAGPSLQGRFLPLAADSARTNFGLTRSVFWLRISLQKGEGAPSRWLLEVDYPSLDSVELYTPADGGFARRASGDLLPFTARPMAHVSHVFPVSLEDGSPVVLYLRIQSQGTVSAPLRLWQPAALWESDQRVYAGLSLYFGMLTGLALYNFLLYLSLRDRLYLLYVAFVVSMAVGQSALTGFGGQFLWPESAWWTNVSLPAGMGLTGIFATIFARGFLSTAQKLPALDKGMVALIALFTICTICAMSLPYWISAWFINVIGVLFSVYIVIVGIVSYRRKHPGARYFILAWSLLLLSAAVLSVHNMGKLPSNIFTTNSLLIGSAFEMLLLSFALADRIHVARQETALAQAEAIRVKQAMVDTLTESERTLERRVAERTGELLQINARLKEKEIQLQQMAHYDALTGLPNRQLFGDRLDLALKRARRHSTRVALLMVDLDDFKTINDTHGHAAGDAALVEVARRLKPLLRDSDTVARLAGDEFVVLVEALDELDVADVIAAKIEKAFDSPFSLGNGRTVQVGASVGSAVFPDEAHDAQALMQRADQAMYKRKGIRRNGA
jgi:diguanylate cyclase (GGDEF)-like protein